MGNKEAAKRRSSSGQSRFKMKKFTSNRFTNEGKRAAEVEQLVDNVLQQEQPSCSTANRSSARYRKLNSRCRVNNKDEIFLQILLLLQIYHIITFFWIAGYYRISCQSLVLVLYVNVTI